MDPIAGPNHQQYLQEVLTNLRGYDTATLMTPSHAGDAYDDLITEIKNRISQI